MLYSKPIIQPAIMADEWEVLIAQIRRLSFAKQFQIDVMDGKFVPERSFPYNESRLNGKTLPDSEGTFYEVHLMVADPLSAAKEWMEAGCRRVVVHIETMGVDPMYVVRKLREFGAKEIGVSILLTTPLDALNPVIDEVDTVQIMSIQKVGYQGEQFDKAALIRIQEISRKHKSVIIEVDGGVQSENIASVVQAGADIVNIGSAISTSDTPRKEYEKLCSQIHN